MVGCVSSVGGCAGHFTGFWARGGGLPASATPVPGVVLVVSPEYLSPLLYSLGCYSGSRGNFSSQRDVSRWIELFRSFQVIAYLCILKIFLPNSQFFTCGCFFILKIFSQNSQFFTCGCVRSFSPCYLRIVVQWELCENF